VVGRAIIGRLEQPIGEPALHGSTLDAVTGDDSGVVLAGETELPVIPGRW
jgi:hypothetical protein